MGSVVSLLIHFGVLWLILREVDYTGLVVPLEQGAGGPGPAGGGGGRSSHETIQYIQAAPPPPAATPKPVLVFTPPEIKQLPPPPVEPVRLEPITVPSTATTGSASVDPSLGVGPGSGGGVGTGKGTGTGSSVGPGTGGGDQVNFPPEATEMFIPPLPVPAPLRGKAILAEFDVDERGKVLGLKFTETGDRSYDRRLTEVLKGYKFRPGHRPDGTPVRMKAQIKIEL